MMIIRPDMRWILLFGILFLYRCSLNRSIRLRNEYPPGVDPHIAKRVFEDSKKLTVDYEAESRALYCKKKGIAFLVQLQVLDSLKEQLHLTQAPSDIKSRILNSSINNELQNKLIQKLERDGIRQVLQNISDQQKTLLEKSAHWLAKATDLNPFDPIAVLDWVEATRRLGEFKGVNFVSTIISQEPLQTMLKMDRGNHALYYILGKTFYDAHSYEEANSAFNKALDALHSYAFFPRNPMSDSFVPYVDSLSIYSTLFRIGDSYVRLYNANSALNAFEEALLFTKNRNEILRVENYMEWIRWANGDIKARELFEEADQLEKEERYSDAARQFHLVIKRIRESALQAFWETSWRLAKLEEQFLFRDSSYVKTHNIGSLGLHRLRDIIIALPGDTLGKPADPSFVPYYNDFARMLYNHAETALHTEGDRKKAESYFSECAVLNSDIQGKACLRMTRIFQNARVLGLLWAIKTYTLIHQLNMDEIGELSILMRRVNRRPRNPFLIQYFNEQFRYFLENIKPSLEKDIHLKAAASLRSYAIHINRYLQSEFKIQPDPRITDQYSRLYQSLEREVPVQKRKEIRDFMTEFFYRNHYSQEEEKIIYSEWRHFLRSLPN
jgi:tetratricopeptide (TPR) repeat protein